jgi:hypothetical protein
MEMAQLLVQMPLLAVCSSRVVDGQHILARHRHSYNKGAQIEDAAHIQALVSKNM